MASRYLLESGAPDGYLLEDGSGVLLLETVFNVVQTTAWDGSNSIVQTFTPQAGSNRGWFVFLFHVDPNAGSRGTTTISYDNQTLSPGLIGSRQFTNNGGFPWDMVQVEVWAADETFIAARASSANLSAQNTGADVKMVVVEVTGFDSVDANNGGASTAGSVTTTVAATAGNQDMGWTFTSSKYAHIAVAVLDTVGSTWMIDGLARNATGDATPSGTQSELYDAAHGTATLRGSVSYREFTAGAGSQTVNLSLAAEVDSVFSITATPGSRTTSLALAAETDTAHTITPFQVTTVALSLASEVDSALTISPAAGARTVSLALASEVDTALALAATLRTTLSLASEVDSAPAPTVQATRAVTLSLASETDSALGLSVTTGARTVSLALTSELDSALTLSVTKGASTVSLALAAEVDTAPSLSVSATRTVTLALVSEADSALTVTPSASSVTRSLALAAEVDTAPTITLVSTTTVGLGVASEADSAPVLSFTATVTIGLAAATETDTALPLVGVLGAATVALGLAAEVDSAPVIDALAINIQRIPLDTASETNTALTLTIRTSAAPAPRRRVGIVGAWTLQPHETVVAMSPNVFAVAVLEPAVVALATIAEPRATMVVQPAAAGEVVYRAPVQR